MQLKEVNKTRYRQRLNRVIIAFIITFAVISIGFGQLFIMLFSTPEADNFKFNFIGVVLALLCVSALLNQLKNKPFFTEIYYVWQLKQLQNKIFRKLSKIKAAAEQEAAAQEAQQQKIQALCILHYYYQSLRMVYLLDDNTLTLNKVNQDYAYVQGQIEKLQLTSEQLNFTPELLETF